MKEIRTKADREQAAEKMEKDYLDGAVIPVDNLVKILEERPAMSFLQVLSEKAQREHKKNPARPRNIAAPALLSLAQCPIWFETPDGQVWVFSHQAETQNYFHLKQLKPVSKIKQLWKVLWA